MRWFTFSSNVPESTNPAGPMPAAVRKIRPRSPGVAETLEGRQYLSASPTAQSPFPPEGVFEAVYIQPLTHEAAGKSSPSANVLPASPIVNQTVTSKEVRRALSTRSTAHDDDGFAVTKAYLGANAFADAPAEAARALTTKGSYSYAGRPPKLQLKAKLEGLDNKHTATRPPKILIIEDEAVGRNALTVLLKRRGFDVVAVATLNEGLAELANSPDRVIVDLMLPDGEGEAILQQVRAAHMHAHVTVMTGSTDPERLKHVVELGAQTVLHKPISLSELFKDLGNDAPN